MNRGQLIDVLDRDVMRDDRRSDYPGWINEGIRSICQDVSWNCMKHKVQLTVLNGSKSVSLPSDFKELQRMRSPIWLDAGGRPVPCDVTDESYLVRLDASFLSPWRESFSTQYWGLKSKGFPVFLQFDSLGVTLNIFDNADEDLLFTVNYYRFLPPLLADSDENYLTVNYTEMVKAKIKAVAFESLNDPAAADWETLYELKRVKASRDDAYRRVAGRRNQMGS